jgi:hypothetical protein
MLYYLLQLISVKLEKTAEEGRGWDWENEYNKAELKGICAEDFESNTTCYGRYFELVHFSKTFTF